MATLASARVTPSAPSRLIVTPLLRRPVYLGVAAGIVLLQAMLVALDWPAWSCPIRQGTGLPCPGCGLSRATVALLHGRFADATRFNTFIWPLAAVCIAMGVVLLLPGRPRARAIDGIERFEVRTHFGAWFVGLYLLFGITRLCWAALG